MKRVGRTNSGEDCSGNSKRIGVEKRQASRCGAGVGAARYRAEECGEPSGAFGRNWAQLGAEKESEFIVKSISLKGARNAF